MTFQKEIQYGYAHALLMDIEPMSQLPLDPELPVPEFKAPPNKPVGFQFDVKQWLGDHLVMAMSLAEQGMHMRLMCIAWQETPPCTLPDNDAQLAQWLNLPVQAWTGIHKKKVMKAWKKVPDGEPGEGRWVLEGLQRSYLRQVTILAARSMAAQTRWQNERRDRAEVTPTPGTVVEEDAPPVVDQTALVWKMGLELLTPEYENIQARKLLGKWIKDYGEDAVAQVLTELSLKAHTVVERYTFITAALVARGKKVTRRRAAGRGDLVL
jgi:uncharacterized protein YdaU (DUF1376 family)